MSNKISTFWELIQKHRIEIPIIQRDYAQGRSNPQSTEIRNNFVSQIREVLTTDVVNKNLHLNFIYGKINGKRNDAKIEENKEAVKNMLAAVKTYSKNLDLDINWKFNETNNIDVTKQKQTHFIPLDGQQRLTTLFLVHLYLMPDTNEIKQTMKRFSYRVRPSSTMFCEKLTDNFHNAVELSKNKELISENIKDSSWFFKYWRKDPTVRGMLKMLDEIHLQFKDIENKSILWKRLNRIQFDFLDLDEYKLTNELYVKMNARGVPLTPFENFKAWLIEYIQENNIELKTFNKKKKEEIIHVKWIELIDTVWTDLFWDNKDNDNMLIDEELMRYFRNMMQIFLVLQDDFKPETDSKNEGKKKEAQVSRNKAALLATTKDDKTGEYKYIPNSFFVENKLLSQENINELFCSINNIASYDKLINEALKNIAVPILFFDDRGSIFKKFIDNKTTYIDKVVYYALHIFLISIPKNKTESEIKSSLRSWIRVIRNLVENSTIDSIVSFKRAINSINSIKNYCFDINDYLSLQNEKFTLIGFDSAQTKEEVLKSLIISDNKNENWESAFIIAENNELLRANIMFRLLVKQTINEFTKRTTVVNLIFNKEGCIYSYSLIRALLIKSNILLLNNGDGIRLINNSSNWKNLLKNDFQIPINELLSELTTDNEANQTFINKLIDDYDDKSELWKYYVVKNAILLDSDASKSKYIRKYWDNHIYLYNNKNGNWINNNNQFLLSNIRSELIDDIILDDIKLYADNGWWKKTDKITNLSFYRGGEIWAKKNIKPNVNIWFLFSKQFLIVGLHKKEEEFITVKENKYTQINNWIVAEKIDYPTKKSSNWKNNILKNIETIKELII